MGKNEEGVWRLLDANANRLREGLRVVEDTARFVLNRPGAAKAFRSLRHEFDGLIRGHYQPLVSHRDVERDSGRTNRSVSYRGGVSELVIANIKRCEEALRVFEEYGRVLSPRAVGIAQKLRFRVYQWEKRLLPRR
jgi:thiamine-phosphate pyrophosphorylase